ncbi:F-box domain, cyclin-like protein [Cynara cardunculus var. scolymus]|uniref:F-box domain, cyclin-like protein n=1 Tax=Cynara cardunculus var. scolymus TaxID=59895 RepID=A0A118JU25_CYNCS|nr:F-box domain, cyclin-like protein [Cynara cardunculus var. scolymus]
MDVVHDRESIIAEEEEDRISNLPDEIIHQILSFLDMKFAIQTSTLSKKWKHIWTSMPYLKFNSQVFHTMPQFAKFVKHVLSHRNQRIEASAVDLTFTGAPNQFVVRSILNYAYSHNVKQLTVIWLTKKVLEFPQSLFRSQTLKHLTLATNEQSVIGRSIPTYAWDFPALETLNLSNMQFGYNKDEILNPFSKCANLKDLTLHRFTMNYLDIFHICAPQLSNLTITDPTGFPMIFNVVAPLLENLTASVDAYHYGGFANYLRLSTEGLDSLEQVNLSMSRSKFKNCIKEIDVPHLLDLFQKLSSVKVLILDMAIIQALPSCLDQLLLEPCPFNNLKCLKIDKPPLKQKDHIPTMPIQFINYFLESSPSVPFIMDIPQVFYMTIDVIFLFITCLALYSVVKV